MSKKELVGCFGVVLQLLALLPNLVVYIWILYSLKAPVWVYVLYGFGIVTSFSVAFVTGIVTSLFNDEQ